MMKPHFHRLAEENSKIIFVSVDVDDLDELASERGVTAMPTFQFYKNNVKVFEMRGAQLDGLKTALAQHQ
jgi:thiol-disulfide isomerase/thioredoxin